MVSCAERFIVCSVSWIFCCNCQYFEQGISQSHSPGYQVVSSPTMSLLVVWISLKLKKINLRVNLRLFWQFMIWPPCFSWVQISANKVVYGSSPCPRTMGLHIFYWKGPPCPRTKGALSLSLPGQKQNQSFKCTQFTHPNSLYLIIASPP